MPENVSGHKPDCDLVTRPNVSPLRGWVCTCKRGPKYPVPTAR